MCMAVGKVSLELYNKQPIKCIIIMINKFHIVKKINLKFCPYLLQLQDNFMIYLISNELPVNDYFISISIISDNFIQFLTYNVLIPGTC